jgi:hypothetical protein
MAKKPVFNLAKQILNTFTSRQAWLQKLLDPRKDLDAECGYPAVLTTADFSQLYKRGDLASRVVSVIPEETWSDDPEIYETEDPEETEFETAWKELNGRMSLLSYLQRADVLSGIGRFGVILLGLDDGLPLNIPVDGIDEAGEKTTVQERELLYVRPLDESLVTIGALQGDSANPRYGLPTSYQIQFADTSSEDTTSTQLVDVHWTRIIHLADNRTNSEIYGIPRMEKVFNRLLDLRKIAGGSGEMFWKGGFPGYSLETVAGKDGEEIELDIPATKKQMEDYMSGLQRYIATVGLQVKSLTVNIADPGPHINVQLQLIGATLGVPWRVLMGSEQAQLASGQDARTWNKRLNRRRQDYVSPFIVRPFIRRLIAIGVLPELAVENTLCVDWKDLNSPSDTEKADVSEKQTNALAKYVQGGVDALMPPFLYLTLILGMSDEEAQAVVDASENQTLKVDGLLSEQGLPAPAPVIVAPNGKPGALPNGRPPPQFARNESHDLLIQSRLNDIEGTLGTLKTNLEENGQALRDLANAEAPSPVIPPPAVNIKLALPENKTTKRKVHVHRNPDGTIEGKIEDEEV